MHRWGDMASATLAVKIARIDTGRLADYTSANSLTALRKDETFLKAFADAKSRIARMELRYEADIEDDDNLAVLEVYAARVLGTKYNVFTPH